MTNDEKQVLSKDLFETWDSFCDELKQTGQQLLQHKDGLAPRTQALGLRLLVRNISLSAQFQMDNIDCTNPRIIRYFDPTRKQGGDNPDGLNSGAPINGLNTYLVKGHRGTVNRAVFTLVESGSTPWGGKVADSIEDSKLIIEEDGSFELLIGPKDSPWKRSWNWLTSSKQCFRLTIRQLFGDWSTEEPMTLEIECLDSDAEQAPESPHQIIEGLDNTVSWLRNSIIYWADMLDRWRQRPNLFFAYSELEKNTGDATPGGAPLICYWKIAPNEALIIRVTPPECEYWSIEFGNYWWESMDYRYQVASFNKEMHHIEQSGELIVVISHNEPNLANWLNTDGQSEGFITYRWIGANSYPKPTTTVVSIDDLASQKKLNFMPHEETQALRKHQITQRRKGLNKRFPH